MKFFNLFVLKKTPSNDNKKQHKTPALSPSDLIHSQINPVTFSYLLTNFCPSFVGTTLAFRLLGCGLEETMATVCWDQV